MTWCLYALAGAWLTVFAAALWFAREFRSTLGSPISAEAEPPVTVIAPIKGRGPHLDEFLQRLRRFTYSDYQILAVVESETDGAIPAIEAEARRTGPKLTLLVAGLSVNEGQKVHNLIFALDRLDQRTAIVAFVDADTLPAEDWLTRLTRPLVREPGIAAVTGHRWIVPEGRDLASGVVASANCSTLYLPRVAAACWGGTLALRRTTIEELEVRRHLSGAVSDDGQITWLLRNAGLRVLAPRALVVRSPVRHSWASAFAFARRQHMCVRWSVPTYAALALGFLAVPVAGGGAALLLALRSDPVGYAALALGAAFAQIRVALREDIARALWGERGVALYARHRWIDRWLSPLWVTFHALAALVAWTSNRMWWAGIRYEVRGRNRVRILARSG